VVANNIKYVQYITIKTENNLRKRDHCYLMLSINLAVNIKADRPLTGDYSNGLAMVIRNYHRLNSASRVLISTSSAQLVQTGECKQFSLFDLDL